MTTRRLTTEQVAARLGIDRASVYAYVSRGLLSSRREGRASTFDAEEVDRLRIAGRAARRPTSSTAVVSTAITELGEDWLAYRGVDVQDLGSARFESVCTWLWESVWDPAERLPGDAAALRAAALPAGGTHARAVVALLSAAAAVEGEDPLTLAPTLVRAVAGPAHPDAAQLPIAELVAARLGVPRARGVVDRALVLLADHDLATSTLAVRVATSTGAPLELAMVAGIGALSGALHGGAGRAALDLLDRCRVEAPGAVLDDLVARHERVPGFGHVVYRRDPRAVLLLAELDDPVVAGLVTAARARALPAPNVDLALAALTRWYGLPDETPELLHLVARCAGWVAHHLEESGERGLRFRPRSVYTGPPRGRRLP